MILHSVKFGEDDARPNGYETLAQAWKRIYGEDLDFTKADRMEDHGDSEWHFFGNRIAISSWPGNSEIWEI